MKYFLEACCTSAADAVAAQRSGAARIELCSQLDIGGVTPSESLIRETLLALAEDTLSHATDSLSSALDSISLALPSASGSTSSSTLPLDAPSITPPAPSSSSAFSTTPLSSTSPVASLVPSPSSVPAISSPASAAALPSVTPPASSPASSLSATPIPVNVLVRPRGGDFIYNEAEIQQTIAAIEICKHLIVKDSAGMEHRVNGVVIGALQADGSIDIATMCRLIAAARPLQITFHRAFDECSDVERALEDIIALGCDRLLTSGHEPDAFIGRFTLARLVRQAAGHIVILAGCGVRPHNIAAIASASSAPEFHSSTLSGW